jgi:hypothetical protein
MEKFEKRKHPREEEKRSQGWEHPELESGEFYLGNINSSSTEAQQKWLDDVIKKYGSYRVGREAYELTSKKVLPNCRPVFVKEIPTKPE